MAVIRMSGSEFETFPAFLKEYATYLVVIKGNAEKTACEYLSDLRTFFRYIKITRAGDDPERVDFETVEIGDLTVADAGRVSTSEIMRYMLFAGLGIKNKAAARKRKLSSLKSLYNYLTVKKHEFEKDPTIGVDAPKLSKSLPKFLSEEEAIKLLETVRSDISSPTVIRDYTIIALFLNTGIRLSELVGLDLTSLDRELTKMKVLGKGSKERFVYLNDMAVRTLEEYLRIRLDPKHIFTSDKALFLSQRQTRISGKTVQWMVHKYLSMAGFGDRGLSVHKLRHTAATLMYQSGEVDIRVLKDILGHEQLNTTQIYTHLVDENMANAMDKNPLANLHIKVKK